MSALKQLLLLALGSAAVLPLLRQRVLTGCVSVLMYHEIGRDDSPIEAWTVVRRSDFLRQLDYLQRHYDLLSLDAAHQRMEQGFNQQQRPAAVLTFDDGNVGNLETLLPIIEERRVPVTVYVATGHVESGQCYWFDRLINALQEEPPQELDLRRYGLDAYRINYEKGARNWAEFQRLLVALKALDTQRREDLVQELVGKANGAQAKPALQPLTIDGVRQLAASNWVTVGAHSHGHELLPQVGEEIACQSLLRSRELLQQWTGQAVNHFAYPSGDYSSSVVDLVRRLGFATAMLTEQGLWRRQTSRFLIPRIAVGRYDSLESFKINLIGGLRLLPQHLSM